MSTRVGIIGTNGIPGNYGGWDQLVKNLVIKLKDQFSFVVYTSYYGAVPGLKEYHGAKIQIVKLRANGIQSIPYDIISIIHASFYCDVLLICGTSGCISLPILRLFGKKIILNPDGLEWKRKKWSIIVRLFLKISENIGVKYSDVLVSDNKKLQEYYLNKYKKNAQLIEYGGDHVLSVPLSEKTLKHYNIKKQEYAFTVCRIEPENNIRMILESFKEKRDISYVLVGNWKYNKYGRELADKYCQYPNIIMLDPIYDQNALDELRSNCSLYIHGHSVGGTNPSLVEAMNLGLCIVAYKVSYNVETTEGKGLYFESKKDLVNILKNYQEKKIDLENQRLTMKEIAKSRYRWDIIADKYAGLFTTK
jgi:glycosyltransferase involved in cell wall biosynthesis